MASEIILWISAGLLAYTYVFYPAIVFISAARRRKRKSETAAGSLPVVSILMTVFNEEKVIREKILSLLASDYPAGSFELIIGSDASNDGTDAIITEFASSDEHITLYRSDKRQGKAAILNDLVSKARGEILIITDANVMPSKDTVRLLAGRFSTPPTGLCDATVMPSKTTKDGITIQENLYSKIETALKRAEGVAWGTMTGPYGGLYAVRRELFPRLPENLLVDDLFVGLTVLQKGYSAYNVPEALVSEDTPPEIGDQLRRRIRIAAGSFQNLFHFGPFPGRSLTASFCFFSHKVMRWFTPLFLALVFMTTIILSGHSVFYFCLLSVQLIFILLSALDMVLNCMGTTLRPLRFATQFIMMNAALVAGLVKALKGINKGIWEPTKRV